MNDTKKEKTRVDFIVRSFQNNKITATIIVVGLFLIGFNSVTDSGENILRRIGVIKTFNTARETNRGQFSSQLLENAWNRMFWMRAYSERVRLNADSSAQQAAYQKYIDASEIWSSRIMNYYLGLDEYYPGSDKRNILQGTIQPKFIEIGNMIRRLKYQPDTVSFETTNLRVDSIQTMVNDVNTDFYFLIDQKDKIQPSK